MKRICHLHISHNTPCLLPSSPTPSPPPPQKKTITYTLFSISSGETENNAYADKVHYERCAIGDNPTFPQGFQVWLRPAALKTRTDSLFLPSPYCETRRLWEEVVKSWCYNWPLIIISLSVYSLLISTCGYLF